MNRTDQNKTGTRREPSPSLEVVIGGLKIRPIFILAPLADYTDEIFRSMIRGLGGCGLAFTEMISSEALTRDVKRTVSMLEPGKLDKPHAVQIYGTDPARMAAAAVMAVEYGSDLIDINLGCPARKITKNGAGAALMREPEKAKAIMKAVRAAVSVPVTVKMRSGWSSDTANYPDLARTAEEEGVNAVTLHPRSKAQGFSSLADWSHIKKLKSFLNIPVIGNGDVRSPRDALRMLRATGCDAVMIGRASLRNPWIFAQSQALLEGREPEETGPVRRMALIEAYAGRLPWEEDEKTALHKARKFASLFSRGIPDGTSFRRRISSIRLKEDFIELIASAHGTGGAGGERTEEGRAGALSLSGGVREHG